MGPLVSCQTAAVPKAPLAKRAHEMPGSVVCVHVALQMVSLLEPFVALRTGIRSLEGHGCVVASRLVVASFVLEKGVCVQGSELAESAPVMFIMIFTSCRGRMQKLSLHK